jgi:phosphatidate cytidylyltransferase
MLSARIFAAISMTLVLAASLYADIFVFEQSLLLHVVFLLCVWQSFREFWPLCRAVGEETFSIWGTGSGCILVVAHYLAYNFFSTTAKDLSSSIGDFLWGIMCAAFLIPFLISAQRGHFAASIGSLAVTCLGIVYLWFLPCFLIKLRHLGTEGQINGVDWLIFGNKLFIATIVVAKGCDLAAYTGGRLFGRRKAFPFLSPGKTVAGVVSGLLGSAGLAFLLRLDFIGALSFLSPVATLTFGLAVGFAGMMGDLSASLLKRSAKIKDSGAVIPGYGGVLDVVDSLIVAGPVAYFLIPVII